MIFYILTVFSFEILSNFFITKDTIRNYIGDNLLAHIISLLRMSVYLIERTRLGKFDSRILTTMYLNLVLKTFYKNLQVTYFY